jgi:predicted MPP superfamily phosphohydrolase
MSEIKSSLLENIQKNSIQIVSDIHLEFYKDNFPIINRHAPYLVIAGDLAPIQNKCYKDFIEIQSKKFEKVFLICGNHEFYSRKYSVDQLLQMARNICESFDNVFLLDRNSYNISEKTVILGATLWSNINSYASTQINDFKKILVFPKATKYIKHKELEGLTNRNINIYLTKEIYCEYHKRDVAYLTEQIQILEEQNKDIIVLTHHAPSLVMNGKYCGNKIESAFATDLTNLFQPPVIAFCNGHIHANVDTKINNIRCVSNCMGYKDEDAGYKENTVIYFK